MNSKQNDERNSLPQGPESALACGAALCNSLLPCLQSSLKEVGIGCFLTELSQLTLAHGLEVTMGLASILILFCIFIFIFVFVFVFVFLFVFLVCLLIFLLLCILCVCSLQKLSSCFFFAILSELLLAHGAQGFVIII